MSDTVQQNDSKPSLSQLESREQQHRVQSDAELLSLYVDGGRRDAIEALIKRYSALVANVCRLTVADPSAAEDAFQATFLVLLKSAKKIKRQESLAAWLHGVAYRTASRIRKKEQIHPINQSTDEVIKQSEDVDDPIIQLARKMELEALDRELENLPDRLRAPLIEHYLMGLSAPQIAKRMELSTAAVEGRLKRGRRQLRTLLAKRGIGLSVLIAGSTLFQQHLHATEAKDWTESFLDAHLPNDGTEIDKTINDSANPNVSSLVKGEISMMGASSLKSALAAGVFIAAGTLTMVALAQYGGGNSGSGNTATQAGYGGENGSQQTTINAPQNGGANPAVQITNAQVVGNPMAGGGTPAQVPANVIWQRPQDTPEPAWLSSRKASILAVEQTRTVLGEKIADYRLEGIPLSEVVKYLTKVTGTHFYENVPEMDLLGVDPDEPISIDGSPTSVREFLRRILDPLELTYKVRENAIEITSKDDADADPAIRFYDLSFILPNASNADTVSNAIQQSIHPDGWLANGGTSTCVFVGSMLVVSAPDSTHELIEVLLMNLSKMNPQNVQQATNVVPSGGGFGGGMGGMGGGMF